MTTNDETFTALESWRTTWEGRIPPVAWDADDADAESVAPAPDGEHVGTGRDGRVHRYRVENGLLRGYTSHDAGPDDGGAE